MTIPSSNPEVRRSRSIRRILRDATLLVVLGVACGTASNLLRGQERLPWVQTKPYDIVVPCPEPVGQVGTVTPASSVLRDFTTFVIDARSTTEFAAWHWPGAVNVPFDWLGPPVAEEVGQLAKTLAASKSQRIVVYGDGDDPDSGREWARLLAGGGIRNVAYVEGGAPALMTASSREGTP